MQGWRRMAEEAVASAFNSITDLSIEDKSEISNLVGAGVAIENGASTKDAITLAAELATKQLTEGGISSTTVKSQVIYSKARVAGYGVRKMFELGQIPKDQIIPTTNQMVTYELSQVLSVNGQLPTYIPSRHP